MRNLNKTNELLKRQKDFLIEKKTNPELEWQDLADMRAQYLGEPEHRDTIRKGSKLLLEYLDAGWDLEPPKEIDYKESIEKRKDGTIVSDKLIQICEGEEITPEVLLKAHNLSPKEWKVVSYRNNYWHSQVKGGKRLVMYQSRVIVKPYSEEEISLQALKEWFEQFEPKPIEFKLSTDYGEGEDCLVMPIVDLHYNLKAIKTLAGNDYNCEKAKDALLSVVEDVLRRTENRKLKKIIFPVGNDLLNANGIKGETFKGTPQENEKHIFEAYTELFEILVYIIIKLANKAPVDVIYIPSNHDKEVTFYLVHNLYTQFKHNDNVNVDYTPTPRKYIRHGSTLMMFAHDAKLNDVWSTVFDEAEDLAGSKYVEVFLSHIHHETVNQKRNVTIRRLPTISGRSTWSNENCYGANQTSQSFIINEHSNVTDILYTRLRG